MLRSHFAVGCIAACSWMHLNGVYYASAEQDTNDPLIVVTFEIKDLPVWRLDEDGKPCFDPSVLISHIKSSAAPGSWRTGGGEIGYSQDERLIFVVQTQDGIEEVRDFLHRQRDFAGRDVAARLKDNLATAAISSQQVLVFISDANSESTDAFFDARHGEHAAEQLQRAFANYIIESMTPVQARQAALWNLPQSRGDSAILIILRADGSKAAEADFDSFRSSDAFDEMKLATFLEEHSEALPDAEELLRSAFTLAAKSDRRVLVQMGGPNCGPCIRLSRYLNAHEELISKDYVYVKLDIRMKSAKDVAQEMVDCLDLIPWMAILSSDRQVLATSLSEEGNIAFPLSDTARKHFQEMLQSTCQRLTRSEVETMMVDLGKER